MSNDDAGGPFMLHDSLVKLAMEHASSTSLPGVSAESNRSYQDYREGSATSKKRAWDLADDTSSVVTSTSMSSESRERRDTECKKCKEPSRPGKSLFRCGKCKYNYHWNCHKPNPGDDFICIDCTKRMKAASIQPASAQPSRPYVSPYAQGAALQSALDTPKAQVTLCEVCTKMALSEPIEGRMLCFIHSVAERHKKAARVAAMIVPASHRPHKEINKRNIYRPNAADKELIVNDPKRKRRRFSNEFQPAVMESTSQKTKRAPARAPSSAYEARMQENHQRSRFIGDHITSSINQPVFGASNYLLPQLSLPRSAPGEPPEDTGFSRPDSARASPLLGEEDSPAYTPPPPAIPDKNPWVEPEGDDNSESVYSPGSQIFQENQAVVEALDDRPELPVAVTEVEAENKNRLETVDKSVDPQSEIAVSEDGIHADEFAHVNDLAEEISESPSRDPSEELDTPQSPLIPPNADPETDDAGEEMDIDSPKILDFHEDLSDLDEFLQSIGEPLPKPDFDGSIVDSFLAQNADNHDHQPTHREILTSQNWGAIDPRVSWPKRLSADEYEEKQAEIAARGTRKENFGKLLTVQVRKDRKERDWGVHQTRDWPDDEESRNRMVHLEELFGLTGIGMRAFVPGTRNGQLVMIEKEKGEVEVPQTGPGRRRKKILPKVFPVAGGP